MDKYQDFLHLKELIRQQQSSWVNERVEIGEYSYGIPTIYSWGEGARLHIGKFCSMADNVSIFLGGNHRTDWITTYPFNSLMPGSFGYIKGHPFTDGDVVIGNDVWIADGVKIMSGVTIGDGAVLAASALVTRDVGEYELVGGVPAKSIRKRFSGEDIGRLLEMKWWYWPEKDICEVIPYLQNDDMDALWDYYKNRLFTG